MAFHKKILFPKDPGPFFDQEDFEWNLPDMKKEQR